MDSTLRVAGVYARVAHTENEEEVSRVLVLDGKATSDRPAAIGYFLLNFIKELSAADNISNNRKGGQYPTLEVTIAEIPVDILRRVDVRSNRLEAEDYGPLYELVSRVEYNKRD